MTVLRLGCCKIVVSLQSDLIADTLFFYDILTADTSTIVP